MIWAMGMLLSYAVLKFVIRKKKEKLIHELKVFEQEAPQDYRASSRPYRGRRLLLAQARIDCKIHLEQQNSQYSHLLETRSAYEGSTFVDAGLI
jgi:hypothetical protein